jgi:hypothetical protein
MEKLPRRAVAQIVALALGLAALGAAPALAAPVTVNLRVEGNTSTIFEGPVTTDAKTLTKDASGPHKCDGTNDNANPSPGPTMTGALDDGSIAGGFTWDGTWFDSLQDFSVDRIGPDANTSSQFWGYALNYQPSQVGGCHQQVAPGDDVLFAYDFFSKVHLLKLTGPSTAEVGQPVTVKVVDGQDGSAIAGATVGGQLTGADGTAQVTFSDRGQQRLKAERGDSVRSNALVVCVHQGDDGTCGTAAPGGSSGAAPQSAVADVLPTSQILGIRDGQRFTTRNAPRLLRGEADGGSAGLLGVWLRIRRSYPAPAAPRTAAARTRCQFYSLLVERFRPGRCAARYFQYRVTDRPDWSYLLPTRPAAGSYVMEAVGVDRKGRRVAARVRFTVARVTPARAAAAAPRVQAMVVGRSRVLFAARTLVAGATTVAVGRRRCAVAAGTPLAALAAVRRAGGPSFHVRDFGACSSRRATASESLFVDRIGGERNAGANGWVYKLGHRAPGVGAGSPSVRARSGDTVLWFYCRQGPSGCQRTLGLTASASRVAPGAPVTFTVRGYDDRGHGIAIAGAQVTFAGATGTSGAGGGVTLAAPSAPSTYRAAGGLAGLVPSFPVRVQVAP